MSFVTKPLRKALRYVGIDWKHVKRSIRGIPTFRSNLSKFKRQMASAPVKDFPISKLYPCLTERFEPGGTASGAYFHQDLHVARRIYERRPARHADVGSRVDGFVAHVSVFCPVEVLDIRAIQSRVPNITFRQADLMVPQPELDGKYESVSCLHAIEHFGLGRYGDPVDYDGHRKGFTAIARLVAPGGIFYLSSPISNHQRVEFDAHRVFNITTLMEMAKADFEVETIAYVDDAGDLHTGISADDPRVRESFGCHYGCGILELRRKR